MMILLLTVCIVLLVLLVMCGVQRQLAVVAGLMAVGPISVARAAPFEVLRLEAARIDAPGDAGPDRARPAYRAVIDSDLPDLTAARFRLERATDSGVVSVGAARVDRYVNSDDALGLVVLVQGDEGWMGNELYEKSAPDRRVGGFRGAARALDVLARSGPPGSRAVLLVYRGGAAELRYDGPLDGLSSKALGTQRDYEGIGIPLSSALQRAAGILQGMGGFRHVLVLIGDGSGEVEDVDPRVREPTKLLKRIGTESFAIHFATLEQRGIGTFVMKKIGYAGLYEAASPDEIRKHAEAIRETLGRRYYVTFPVPVGMAGTSLDKSYEVVIKLDDHQQTVSAPLFAIVERANEERAIHWLWYVAIALGLMIVIGFVVVRRAQGPSNP